MMSTDLLEALQLNLRKGTAGTEVWDILRRKWVFLTPEEHVRQALIHYLTRQMNYPGGLMSVERQIHYGTLKKRYDLVVYNKEREPWMLIECKAPDVPVNDKVLHQLLQYRQSIPAPFWVLTNGHTNYCADASDIQKVVWLNEFPQYPENGSAKS